MEADWELCGAIERETGVPASTAFLAQLEAMEQCAIRRYALATPYQPKVNAMIIELLNRLGFECVRHAALGISVNREFSTVPLDLVRRHVMPVGASDVGAILVVCTNFPAAFVLDDIEHKVGLPVINSTLAGIWRRLRVVGVTTPIHGRGRLLRNEVMGPRSTTGGGEFLAQRGDLKEFRVSYELLIRGAQLRQRAGLVDIGTAGGRITAIGAGLEGAALQELDAGGRLVTEPFVDCHFHIDEAFTGAILG